MEKNTVALPTDDGMMDAFFVVPDKEPKKSAVIVIQEAFGVNSHIKDICLRLRREGYMAIAPELYHRSGSGLIFDYNGPKDIMMATFSKLTNATIEMDVAATIRFLTEHEGVNEKQIAVIGFCMGGFAAFLTACRFDIGMAFAFYGAGIVNARPGLGLEPLLDEAANIRMPVLCVFGGIDKGIPPEDVDAVRGALDKQTQYPHEVIVYPEAGHGFFCEERASYQAESASDAWKKVLSWLSKLNKG